MLYEFDTDYVIFGELLVGFLDLRRAAKSLMLIDEDSPLDFRFDDAGNLWKAIEL